MGKRRNKVKEKEMTCKKKWEERRKWSKFEECKAKLIKNKTKRKGDEVDETLF